MAPSVPFDREVVQNSPTAPQLTWIGHASFLGGLAGTWFLVDPVFNGHAGVLYPRFARPGLAICDLPDVGVVMVTHNHYDHLDAEFLGTYDPEVPVVVPRGLGGWMRRRRRKNVFELEWWESLEIAGLKLTLVPSCHWSRRGIFDTNRTLWGGFVIEGGGESLYHASDTAWFDGFAEIGHRFPDLLAAMLPIGSYEPAWFMEHYHLNPEQAGRAFLELGARYFLPMHWGTFQLTDEALCEPADRVRAWWDRHGPRDHRRMLLMAHGETKKFA